MTAPRLESRVLLTHLAVRGFRNLADGTIEVPASGVALLGANGQGKTNLLEAVAYPVLLRSFRGAPDSEVVRHEAEGFRIEALVAGGTESRSIEVGWTASGRRKQVALDGAPEPRPLQAIGRWLAVVFQPADVALAGGAAEERRRFLDRMLALADPEYLRALLRYRAALRRRNAALRQQQFNVARACEPTLAVAGAAIVRSRLEWISAEGAGFSKELGALGEPGMACLTYAGGTALAEAAAWPDALAQTVSRERRRGATGIGPHRDDLRLTLDGRPVRTFGSTGQIRSAAIALRLLERETYRRRRAVEPALVLDDIFAELDAERQRRLMARLRGSGSSQIFVTAPRADELPQGLELPTWQMRGGRIGRAA
jgi:DNA replication and repair protein RecF